MTDKKLIEEWAILNAALMLTPAYDLLGKRFKQQHAKLMRESKKRFKE